MSVSIPVRDSPSLKLNFAKDCKAPSPKLIAAEVEEQIENEDIDGLTEEIN